MAAKSEKPVNASDSDIASLIAQGKNNSEISRILHADRKRIAKIRDLINAPSDALNKPVPIDTVRAIVRLELSQEEAITEFSKQLSEYTENYNKAMEGKEPDVKAAGYWASLRLRLLENLIKISGLDKRCDLPVRSPQEALSNVSDEEVISRVRAIIARRDGK